jgi:pimeloyl-ACP methyl ester carboxylesterase
MMKAFESHGSSETEKLFEGAAFLSASKQALSSKCPLRAFYHDSFQPENTLDYCQRKTKRSRNIYEALLILTMVAGLLLYAVSGYGQTSPAGKAQTVRNEKSATARINKNFGAAITQDTAIRPFRVNVSEESLAELRRRLAATRFPDRETVNDRSQGIQLAKFEELIRYWRTDYDWRKAEAKLNALPQFVTKIDGVDVHFIHVRSKEPNALPIIITHGWPGSIIEQLKVIEPLTNPTRYNGKAADAFDVVIPSIPGFGFSGKPTDAGWNPDRIARAWGELMKRLGYTRYVAQGGDWGSPISSSMARQAVPGLVGIHINLPAAVPTEIAAALAGGGAAPAGLSQKEQAAFDALATFTRKYRGYAQIMGTRPQTIGLALTDTPAGLAAWIFDYNNGEPERLLNRDDVLDNVTLYWLTNTAASSARIYWETAGQSVTLSSAQKTAEIALPVAITVFPGEVYRTPETWARRAYRNLIYFNEVEKGGHFAAWEQPQLFAEEVRAAFKSLR